MGTHGGCAYFSSVESDLDASGIEENVKKCDFYQDFRRPKFGSAASFALKLSVSRFIV